MSETPIHTNKMAFDQQSI